MKRKTLFIVLAISFSFITVFAQTKIKLIAKNNPGISAIREDELKKDLYAMASDHFRGREAGTLDELKDAMWWADQLKIAGLKPAVNFTNNIY